ncbi:cyclic nucleotide-binding domain-containing protein [Bdellovibrio sp. SKB1291214]|uniref:Crp/Fnr family transcriptional regulator n=1 Tax=Bdellovibrio sp. SKB1291214 TaxID=1732569 RepID=UPI000B518416|nr:cyclic nucleotide-binding domain-containing protein [Bdellovibrio sp. SKB1291214]UYL07536.1 cyclic nucleotide-binding domain-containing protein [Bdellovibrio sp. SKB1291214]
MSALEQLHKLEYKAGEFIFFQGDIEKHFYIIETGTVKICTLDRSGKEVEINTITDGESFGEFALLDNAPRSASAKCMTDVVVVQVSEEGFQELLNDLPVWANCMLKSFVSRLKKMMDDQKDQNA